MKGLEDKYWNKAPNNPETNVIFEKENKDYRSQTHIHTIASIKHSKNIYCIDMVYSHISILKDGTVTHVGFAMDRNAAIGLALKEWKQSRE